MPAAVHLSATGSYTSEVPGLDEPPTASTRPSSIVTAAKLERVAFIEPTVVQVSALVSNDSTLDR